MNERLPVRGYTSVEGDVLKSLHEWDENLSILSKDHRPTNGGYYIYTEKKQTGPVKKGCGAREFAGHNWLYSVHKQ